MAKKLKTRKRRAPADERLAAAFERGELERMPLTSRDREALRAAARLTPVKDRRINIRLASRVFHELQARAAEEGLPYQTLIASVLHKYVHGKLIERTSRNA